MLDQNTDRMWYVIGAIVIGAAIIAMGLNIFSDSFDSVEDNFRSMNYVVMDNMGANIGRPIYTDDEIDDLINNQGYIPVATSADLQAVGSGEMRTWAEGSKWESNTLIEAFETASYIQVDSIDLSDIEEFKPIGSFYFEDLESYDYTSSFKGVYDGGGHYVTGLTIVQPDVEYVGLFGSVYGSTIKNMYVYGGNVQGSKYVGGLIGIVHQSKIENVSYDGIVQGTDHIVGGLVGWNGNGSIITDSSSSGHVRGGYDVGGFVGENGYRGGSTIRNSYTTAKVSGSRNVGGFVGIQRQHDLHYSIIEDSYFNTELAGVKNPAGIRYGISSEDKGPAHAGLGLTSQEMQEDSPFINWSKDVWQFNEGSFPRFK